MDEAQDECQVDQQHAGRTDEALLLAHGAEDEVCVLLGHILELGLRAVEESLARHPARADGNLGLIDIIPHPRRVLDHAEQHFYPDTLVVLQNLAEHIARRIEEARRHEREQTYPCRPCHARDQPTVEIVEGKPHDEHDHGTCHVKRHHPPRHRDRCRLRHQTDDGHRTQALVAAEVHPHHRQREDKDEAQHGKRPLGSQPAGHHRLVILDADNEVDDHGHPRERYGTGQSLTIEHDKQGEKDKGRPRLILPHNQCHGDKDDEQHLSQIAPPAQIEAISTHQLGQHERRGKLGKLRRLDIDRPERQPAARPLDVIGQKDSGKQQCHHGDIDVGSHALIGLAVEHHQHEAKDVGTPYPHQLLARAGGEVKQVRMVETITRAAHRKPPEECQQHKESYRHPVDATHYVGTPDVTHTWMI